MGIISLDLKKQNAILKETIYNIHNTMNKTNAIVNNF